MNSETRLTFPLDVVPKSGSMHAINEHVLWIRMPLPMSLNHINLVVAIESEVDIKFNFDELSTLKDVGAMMDLILKKIN